MLVNATYWALGMEGKLSAPANVTLVGDFKPTPFKFGGFTRDVKPSDHAMK